jgi:hypothetical protein
VAVDDCPFDGRLDASLCTVERRLAARREDAGRVLAAHGGVTARAALARLVPCSVRAA